MTPKHKHNHHKILLDEDIAPREKFPLTNKRHDIKHIKHDYKYEGLGDQFVYVFAKKQKRTIVTSNYKDFRGFEYNEDFGLIGMSQRMTAKEADSKLCSFLSNRTKGQVCNRKQRLSNSTKTR